MTDSPVSRRLPVEASAPCRVDFGGTLDLPTFFLPLRHMGPCTVNVAVGMRTRVRLSEWKKGQIKVSSTGFASAEYPAGRAPYNHSLGLMFAVAAFFNADGVHIDIDSASPPRSALGGSSSACLALVAAFMKASGEALDPARAVLTANAIEASVAGVPCGMQDHLAAAYGGVNLWRWVSDRPERPFEREELLLPGPAASGLDRSMLVAYCGIPHESRQINKRWVNQFLSGENRDKWETIVLITQSFADAVSKQDFATAADLMNQETRLRLEMTPDVLDRTGLSLVKAAVSTGCGARFTGAGGGGCIWAVGEPEAVAHLKPEWNHLLAGIQDAGLLEAPVESRGIIV